MGGGGPVGDVGGPVGGWGGGPVGAGGGPGGGGVPHPPPPTAVGRSAGPGGRGRPMAPQSAPPSKWSGTWSAEKFWSKTPPCGPLRAPSPALQLPFHGQGRPRVQQTIVWVYARHDAGARRSTHSAGPITNSIGPATDSGRRGIGGQRLMVHQQTVPCLTAKPTASSPATRGGEGRGGVSFKAALG